MQLLAGFIVVVLGVLIVRGCIRSYRNNPGRALWNDLGDMLNGSSLSITGAAILMLIGAGMMLIAFGPVTFSSKSPFVIVAPPAAPHP